MKISKADWDKYKNMLASISERAVEEMESWITSKGGYMYGDVTRDEIIEYAYALATKYGEASASLAAQMYDEVAEASGVIVPSAEVAETASYGEIAKAVNGIIKSGSSDKVISNAVGKYVKRAGQDTTLKNAERDGAQFAWVPSGDTCAFCITLASRGWQYMSKKAMRNGHAEHIHPKCDCAYQVRFDKKTTVEGYDPDKYLEMYQNAEGDTWQDKVNSMRRIQYQENKDKINAQKRANYKEKKEKQAVTEKEKLHKNYPNNVQINALDAPGYVDKFQNITGNEDVDEAIYNSAIEILKHRNNTDFEDIYFIDANSGETIHKLTTCNITNGVEYDDETKEKIKEAKENKREIITVHNHPGGLPPSLYDGASANKHGYKSGVVVGHNLEVYTYTPTDIELTDEQCEDFHNSLSDLLQYEVDLDEDFWYDCLEDYGMKVRRK